MDEHGIQAEVQCRTGATLEVVPPALTPEWRVSVSPGPVIVGQKINLDRNNELSRVRGDLRGPEALHEHDLESQPSYEDAEADQAERQEAPAMTGLHRGCTG